MGTLTQTQKATLRAALIADPAVQTWLNSSQLQPIVDLYNQLATPAFWAFRTDVDPSEIGKVVNYVAVAAMTTANLQRVSDFLRMNTTAFIARDDIKTFLLDTFSGALGGQGQATRDALDLMLRRQVTKAERLFTTGTGSTSAPATLGWVGPLTTEDISEAIA
jgi:hypothetical protein